MEVADTPNRGRLGLLVVFVRKVRTASGATARQIAERQDGRDKVLEHLGSARTDAELTALLEVARAKIYPGQEQLDLTAGSVPAGQAVITSKSSALLWHVLASAYARLGFDPGSRGRTSRCAASGSRP